MPEKFQTVGFPLKKYEMFSVHTTPEEFENATITVIVVLCLNKTRSEGRLSWRDRFRSIFKMFSVHTKTKSRRFQIPSV